MQDPAFVKFLAHLPARHKAALSSRHYLVLDLIRRNRAVPRLYLNELSVLRSVGLIGSTGHGRGVRYTLSTVIDKHSRHSGRESPAPSRSRLKKQIVKLIESSGGEGCTVGHLLRSTPQLSRDQLRWMLRQLQAEGRIRRVGKTKAARWVPAAH